ncbi:DUF3231 family protein [Paenibacillus antri]|uniref:DUF3231 family protein n=1 Tax=Paenibacillus antri TaxID=2582848 RepID=UPI0013052155|nr:DUF3231 family protein [Paenibacillus antri]
MNVVAHRPKLTSAEVAALWTQYMNDSAGLCVARAMQRHLEDPDTKAVFDYSTNLGTRHMDKIASFLKSEGYPVPTGFSDRDLAVETPRLFTDVFCLNYLNIMSLHGCHGYSGAVTTSSRSDARSYFTECATTALELCNRTKDLLLEKGLYFRPPTLVPPSRVDFVTRESFLSGWFHDTRPLSCIEITDILFNLKKSILAKGLAVAFRQTASSDRVRSFLDEAVRTKEKHISMFNKIMEADGLPTPTCLTAEITDSAKGPFSDKLMMFLIGFLFSSAMVYYGSGLASSPRKDLAPKYMMAIADDLKVGGEWMSIMIDNGWLEQPPLAENRHAVAGEKH